MSDDTDPNEPLRVTLGGREFSVPEMGIRQLRKLRRPLIDLTDIIQDGSRGKTAGDNLLGLSDADYDRMVDCVYVGLTRANDIGSDEFENIAATDREIFQAFLVVRRQSGVFDNAPAAVKAAPEGGTPGEDLPGETETRTGTG